MQEENCLDRKKIVQFIALDLLPSGQSAKSQMPHARLAAAQPPCFTSPDMLYSSPVTKIAQAWTMA